MENINSYNSTYPLAYYEIGQPYAFYALKAGLSVEVKSCEEDYTDQEREYISKYGDSLNSLEDMSAIGEADNNMSLYQRFIGIVVDKVDRQDVDSYSYITVIAKVLKNGKNMYIVKDYVTSSGKEVLSDNKEGSTAVACINLD